MNKLLNNTSTRTDNPDSVALRLERPSLAMRRQLGGDPPMLVCRAERARSWLGAAVVPPTVRVEAGREIEMLSSTVVAALMRLGVPLLFLFEAGWPKVTAFAGMTIELESRS
jgi:hypothetical protein